MATKRSGPTSRLGKVNVLVVDNDTKILELMIGVLKKLGFTSVFSAQDGFQAVEAMRSNKIDLIITDWELHPKTDETLDTLPPNSVILNDQWDPVAPKDGACFVKYIRGSKYSPNPYIAIIMLTGLALRKNVEYARDSGVNEVVLKPVSAESLCHRITLVVDDKRNFITAQQYKGPCRRRAEAKPGTIKAERRKHDIRVYKYGS